MERIPMYQQERVIVHCDLAAGKIGIRIDWMDFTARRMESKGVLRARLPHNAAHFAPPPPSTGQRRAAA